MTTTETAGVPEAPITPAAPAGQDQTGSGAQDTGQPPAGPQEGAGGAGEGVQGEPEPTGRAKTYRDRMVAAETKVAEVEAARDKAAARVLTLQIREVARLAGSALAVGSDLLTFAKLDDLLTDDEVDPAKVAAAASEVVRERPGLGKVTPVPPPDMGQGHHPATGPTRGTWTAVLRGQDTAPAG